MKYSKHKEKLAPKKQQLRVSGAVELGKLSKFCNLLTTICMAAALSPVRLWRATGIGDQFAHLVTLFKNKFGDQSKQRSDLLEWVCKKTGGLRAPRDFTADWTDGVTLCALLEALRPGACPRYDLLRADEGLSNIRQAILILEHTMHVHAELDERKLHEGKAESALIHLLTRLKLVSAKRRLRLALGRPIVKVTSERGNATELRFEDDIGEHCFAKGMGLILAVRGRRARFNIFFRSVTELNLIVEIIGPDNSRGRQRLMDGVQSLLRLKDKKRAGREQERGAQDIPLSCEILRQKVCVTYVPVVTGVHTLSIIWDGQHITGSPYTVKVDESTDKVDGNFSTATPPQSSHCFPLFKGATNRTPLKSTVIRRRVLKQVVIVNGQEIAFDGDQLNLFGDVSPEDGRASPKSRRSSVHMRPRLAEIVRQKFAADAASSDAESEQHDQVSDDETRTQQVESSDVGRKHSVESVVASSASLSADENLSESPTADLVCNFALTNVQAPLEIFDKTINSFDDILNESDTLLNSSGLDIAFEKLAMEAVDDLAAIEDISSLLDRSFTPFRSYLPRAQILQLDGDKAQVCGGCGTPPQQVHRAHHHPPHLPPLASTPKSRLTITQSAKLSCGEKERDRRIAHTPLRDKIAHFESPMRMTQSAKRALDKGADHVANFNKTRSFWQSLQSEQQQGKCDVRNWRKLQLHELEPFALQPDAADDVATPDSQADSGIGPATAGPQILLDAIKLSVAAKPKSAVVHDDVHDEVHSLLDVTSNLCNKDRPRKRSHSFPLLRNEIKSDGADGDLPEKLSRSSSRSSSSWSDKQTLTNSVSALGFIDDEIRDCSTFGGANLNHSSREDLLTDYEQDDDQDERLVEDVHAELCRAFGSGLYYGQVGARNTFQVATQNAGLGFLSVTMKGLCPEDVTLVATRYAGSDVFEVTYEVSRAGHYLTIVRWGDHHIPDSPFVCKVTV